MRIHATIACYILAVVLIAGALPIITVHTHTPFTCTTCLTERSDDTLFGYLRQSFRENEFSEWYRLHRPKHQHQWKRSSCTRGSSLFGTVTYFSCGIVHPVCDIPPEVLKEFAEHADNSTLDFYFKGITSPDPDLQQQAVQMVLDKFSENVKE